MIVAGIGCRKGATTASVVAAIHAALSARELGVSALGGLATLAAKRDEAGIVAAAKALSLDLIVVNEDAAAMADPRAISHSSASLAATGTRSASETAALAAAGPSSRLLAPRLVLGDVTCALAASGDVP
ncbi:MAG: cobalamin biosynthesis protein [Rhizobiaceae bacterium]|nr:cobalamin biosynthesis protein [Rhizobiaceae bacterium]